MSRTGHTSVEGILQPTPALYFRATQTCPRIGDQFVFEEDGCSILLLRNQEPAAIRTDGCLTGHERVQIPGMTEEMFSHLVMIVAAMYGFHVKEPKRVERDGQPDQLVYELAGSHWLDSDTEQAVYDLLERRANDLP